MKRNSVYFLIAAALMVGACHRTSDTPADAAAAEPAAKVEVTPLKAGPIAQTLEVFGIIAPAPAAEHTVAAPFDCVIRQVRVVVGAHVAAGEVLLEISASPDMLLQLDSARSTLALAGKTLADTQGRYDLKLATSQELLTAQQGLQDAQLKVASLEARGLGGDGKITAAKAGVVSTLAAASGALAPVGTALVTVVTDGQLEARLGVQTAEVAQVNPGQPVMLLSINRDAGDPIPSAVRQASGLLDAATGTAEVRVPVPAGAALLLGEHVRALIELRKKTLALVVPRSAVLPDDGKQFLFTVKDGKAVRHEVQVGITADDLVEVIGENLHDGDPVVTLGNYELTDGMAIQPKENAAEKDAKAPAEKPPTAEVPAGAKAPAAKEATP